MTGNAMQQLSGSPVRVASPMTIDTPDVRPPELDEHVSPAMQSYLMVIAGAQRDGTVTPSAVARALACSAPSALEMLRRLATAGMLIAPGRNPGGWRLTSLGHREVAAIRRRHSVLEQFLRISVGMDGPEAAREAALLGPAVSSNLESRLRDVMWPSTRPCRPAED